MSLIKSSQIDQPVNLSGSFIGEFSGSFSGSGAGLSDIPASAIIGLNLSQISSGSVSASISPNNGLQVNTNVTATSFTGSLLGTASYASTALSSSFATTASYALTASYIEEYVTNSIYNTFTSSYYIDSASFNYRIENILIPTGSGSSENNPVTVNAATTTVLPRSPLYNNGTNGVGAFLSASISGTLGNIDGVTLTTEDHLLVKNQANPIQNGVYDVVSTGSASGYYLLSRSLSSDETSELDSQIVIPSFGTTNKGGIFAQTTNNPVIGTDNIVYSQQTNTLINQASAGTQAVYQIPWYVSTARQLSKGSPNFKYINVTSGNTVTTSSLLLTGSFRISGSLNVTNGITGSLLGTASFATTASYWSGSIETASFAFSSSYATTASYVLNAVSASYAATAALAPNYVLNSATSSFVLNSQTSSFAITGSNRFNGNQTITGSLIVSGALTTLINGLTVTGSTALSGSLSVIGTETISGTLIVTGSGLFTTSVTASTTLISGSGVSRLTVVGSGSSQPLFTVLGSQGELFSITDVLSGSLFSVNDISGLPILEVFSDSTTLQGNYLAPSLNTTAKVTTTNSGSFYIYGVPTSSYDGLFMEYTAKSGSTARAGNFMSIWSGSSVNYSETSTTDFGNTSALTFTGSISGSNMVITGNVTTGSGWTVKAIIRSI